MQLVISCEHADHAVPPEWEHLFPPDSQPILHSHRGWDPGARELSRGLARDLGTHVLEGTVTRLLLDLNRSPDNPGRWSEFTRDLPSDEKDRIHRTIYLPYLQDLRHRIDDGLENGECVLHVSIHSFVRAWNGKERTVDVGLLFDPARQGESQTITALETALRAGPAGKLRIRRNEPYAGADDGLTTLLRTVYPDERYQGIEIEVCSHLLERAEDIEEIGKAITAALKPVLR